MCFMDTCIRLTLTQSAGQVLTPDQFVWHQQAAVCVKQDRCHIKIHAAIHLLTTAAIKTHNEQ